MNKDLQRTGTATDLLFKPFVHTASKKSANASDVFCSRNNREI